MKKVFIAALAVCGFSFANAQSVSSASTTPGGLAGPVTSSATVSVTLYNALELNPAAGVNFSATYANAADYNAGAKHMGTNTWTINSTRPGNVQIAVSALNDAIGGGTIPVSAMSVSTDNSTFVTAPSGAATFGNFSAGAGSLFSLSMKVNPGWSYSGGVYTGSVTVTCSQL